MTRLGVLLLIAPHLVEKSRCPSDGYHCFGHTDFNLCLALEVRSLIRGGR